MTSPLSRRAAFRSGVLAGALAAALPVATLPDVALGSPLASATGIAAFAGPRVTPDDAARKRVDAQVLGRDLANADPAAAGMHYDTRAAEWGDPILYLDAADAYLAAADKDGEIPMAEAGIERARIALDLLYFQLDPSADKDFRLVETGDIPTLISRANATVDRGEKLLEDLASRTDEAAVAAAPTKEKRKRKPIKTKPMFISGAVLAALGGGLVGVGGVGLIIGAVNQKKAEDPTVYGTAYDDVAAKGDRGNLIAGVGLGVGGALVLGGAAMMIIAKVAEKKQGKAPKEKNISIAPALRGVAISGRF